MNETIIKRLGNLMSVKSLVTLVLTVVFAVMTVRQAISQDFMTIYAVIIAFYFGTQSQKVQDAVEDSGEAKSTIVLNKESISSVEEKGDGDG